MVQGLEQVGRAFIQILHIENAGKNVDVPNQQKGQTDMLTTLIAPSKLLIPAFVTMVFKAKKAIDLPEPGYNSNLMNHRHGDSIEIELLPLHSDASEGV